MKSQTKLENYTDSHYIGRSNWLRAAVLGANDGILSVASIAVGVSSANAERETIILATLAGLVAGTLSMSSGEYVSVSSQTDIEQADIEREAEELRTMPELELQMLTNIYIERGLKEETAKQVAMELTEKDALAAHVRDELGITDTSRANPIQAAFSSAIAFLAGGSLPFLFTLFFPIEGMEYWLYAIAILSLCLLGALSAKAGGAGMEKAVIRIAVWGTIAMAVSAGVGYLFGVNI